MPSILEGFTPVQATTPLGISMSRNSSFLEGHRQISKFQLSMLSPVCVYNGKLNTYGVGCSVVLRYGLCCVGLVWRAREIQESLTTELLSQATLHMGLVDMYRQHLVIVPGAKSLQ